MRSWLAAAGEILPLHFKEVEIWSMECELDFPWVKWRRFRKISKFWPIQCAAFRRAAWKQYWKLPAEYRANTLIQCTGEQLPIADSRYIHFWNLEYASVNARKPEEMSVSAKEKFFRYLAIRGERKILKPGATGEWWCVSRGIADPIKKAAAPESIFRYLPNSFDPTRFNQQVRTSSRATARDHYGFGPDEIVLVFCSFGHFLRKGLLQAVEALEKLRAAGYPVRLLVLGGLESTVNDFKKLMARKNLSSDGIVFAGLVSSPEWHLSAGDALIFPSHFEAFSLVEIEAAALGLRLYLTPHPGSEMVLREGINGRLLPWDVEGMISILEDEVRSGAIRRSHSEMGEALTPAAYASSLSKLYSQAIHKKNSSL